MKINFPKFKHKNKAVDNKIVTPSRDWYFILSLFVLFLLASFAMNYLVYLSLTSTVIETPDTTTVGPRIKKVELDKIITSLREANSVHQNLLVNRP